MARNPLRTDPTRTSALRARFLSQMRARFNRLRRAVIHLVGVEDCFGLNRPKSAITPLQLNVAGGSSNLPVVLSDSLPPAFLTNERFAFLTDDRKVDAFNRWLREQVNQGILEAEGAENPDEPWTAEFTRSAYRQAVLRAYQDTHRLAATDEDEEDGDGAFYRGGREQFLNDAFAAGQPTAKIRMLATRSYEALKNVTTAMSTQMGRTLALGFAEGRGAMDLARRLAHDVEAIGRNRAEMVARTEIIHAYAEAQLDSFERLGIEEVGVMAEFSTAGDGKVCERCAALEGVVLKVSEARGLIPVHTNCRCAFRPANIGEPTKGQKRTKAAIEAAIDKAIQAERPNLPLEEAKEKSTWAGADKSIAKKRDPGASPTGTTPFPTKDGDDGDDGDDKPTVTTTTTPEPELVTTPTPTTAAPTTAAPTTPRPTTTTTTTTAAPVAQPSAQQFPKPARGSYEVRGNVSGLFVARVNQAVESIPDNVHAHLAKNGQKIVIGEYTTEILPSLKGQTPRGWPAGYTWDQAEGFHSVLGKIAATAEKKLSYNFATGKVDKTTWNSRVQGTLRHEVGHAVDYAEGYPKSFSSDFRKQYEKDVGEIKSNPEMAKRLSYFLQAGNAGPAEAFAEGFAVLHGGGGADREEFEKAFPNTLAAIKEIVSKL